VRRRHASALLTACLLAAAALAAAGAAGLSPELARGLDAKLKSFERQARAGGIARGSRVLVSQAELNSYLNLLAPLPPSLSDVRVTFERDRLSATGLLDLDQLQGRIPQDGALGAFSLFSGRVAVSLRGKLVNEQDAGFGRVELEDVRLGSIPIAASVLGQVIASATKGPRYPGGVDILAPFRYPYSARRVHLVPGRVVIEF
jgi:hypothetical protein